MSQLPVFSLSQSSTAHYRVLFLELAERNKQAQLKTQNLPCTRKKPREIDSSFLTAYWERELRLF